MSPLLLVEDESELAESCARLLRRRGYRVVVASSYEEGRAALTRTAPSLLVTDVGLPDGDGIALVVAATALEPAVPAVAMSALNRNAAAVAAGAIGFLAKPFTLEDFGRTIDRALGR